jgi:hypothetical protein
LSFTNSPAATTTYSVSSAIDVNGCTATTAGTATITVNSLTNPTITPVPASLCANSAGNVASCPVGMASYAWTITNGVITSAPNLPAITYIAGASGAVGLTLVVANAFGCPATNSMSVPIPHDNTPPTIVCSSNLVITAPGRCAAPVNFTVSASDNCSLASVTATPPSGSYFPLGTNIVNVVAADVAGNTNSCSFLVTVLPGPDPVLNIVTSGTNAILSWSNSYACYSLLSSPTLDSPIASNPWTAYTGPFTTNSGFVFVTNGVDNATRYFRLVH